MSFLKARLNAGLTQSKAAEAIGVTPTAISYWESGQCMPRATLLVRIASLYGCTVDELLSDGKMPAE